MEKRLKLPKAFMKITEDGKKIMCLCGLDKDKKIVISFMDEESGERQSSYITEELLEKTLDEMKKTNWVVMENADKK